MNKITPEHLSRGAIVYIRQSTPGQVANNLESKRRQYGLADRARQVGWQEVTVIDDDQGHSGSGIARVGFEKLLVAVGAGQGSARCSRLRPRAWRAMAGIGTHFWSSAASSEP